MTTKTEVLGFINDLHDANLDDIVSLLKDAQKSGARVGLIEDDDIEPHGVAAAVWIGDAKEAAKQIAAELNGKGD